MTDDLNPPDNIRRPPIATFPDWRKPQRVNEERRLAREREGEIMGEEEQLP